MVVKHLYNLKNDYFGGKSDWSDMQGSQGKEELIQDIKGNSFEDRAYGCIIGAFAGDACGSYLEFSREIISE